MSEEQTESNAIDTYIQEASHTALADYIRRAWNTNVEHRNTTGITKKLDKILHMVRCEYTAREISAFQSLGIPDDLYTPLADTKVRAAKAMMGELFTNPGDKPWTLAPTPVPEVPEAVMAEGVATTMVDWMQMVQMTGQVPPPEAVEAYAAKKVDEIEGLNKDWAKTCCERMERRVYDEMVEGNFTEAFNKYVDYVCTYGTALLKGPIPRVRRKKVFSYNKLGQPIYKMDKKIVLEYEAVSPWDCYPAPNARNINDGNLCIKVSFTPKDLRTFASLKTTKDNYLKGWNQDATNYILDLYPDGGFREILTENNIRAPLENDGYAGHPSDCMIEGIEFYGDIKGDWLIEEGITKTIDGKRIVCEDYYEVTAISIDDVIVYCRVIEPEIGRPLSKGVFYSVADSWWGDSLVLKCEAAQRMCNATLRDLVVNIAQASGPQAMIHDLHTLHPDCQLELRPWKIWLFQRAPIGGGNTQPMSWFQPVNISGDLIQVFDKFKQQADEDTGIPAYTYGTNVSSGAGRTASGLAMLTEAATRGMKMVLNTTDLYVIRKTVERTVSWLMLYDKDNSIKGDIEVHPSGLMGLILREQEHNRLLAFLQLVTNEIDMQLLGPFGRVEILRAIAKSCDLNVDKLVPSPEKLKEAQEMNELKQILAMEQQQAQIAATKQGLAMRLAAQQEQPIGAAGTPARVRGGSPGTHTLPGRDQMNHVMNHPQERAMQGAMQA
jgi:hypothetical protein